MSVSVRVLPRVHVHGVGSLVAACLMYTVWAMMWLMGFMVWAAVVWPVRTYLRTRESRPASRS